MESETRFAMLSRSHPEAAERFLAEAQKDAERRFKAYQELAQTVIPAKAGIQRSEATMRLHPGQQTQWHALYRRDIRPCKTGLGAQTGSCRGFHQAVWRAYPGLV
jgi:hypothetical protein